MVGDIICGQAMPCTRACSPPVGGDKGLKPLASGETFSGCPFLPGGRPSYGSCLPTNLTPPVEGGCSAKTRALRRALWAAGAFLVFEVCDTPLTRPGDSCQIAYQVLRDAPLFVEVVVERDGEDRELLCLLPR